MEYENWLVNSVNKMMFGRIKYKQLVLVNGFFNLLAIPISVFALIGLMFGMLLTFVHIGLGLMIALTSSIMLVIVTMMSIYFGLLLEIRYQNDKR